MYYILVRIYTYILWIYRGRRQQSCLCVCVCVFVCVRLYVRTLVHDLQWLNEGLQYQLAGLLFVMNEDKDEHFKAHFRVFFRPGVKLRVYWIRSSFLVTHWTVYMGNRPQANGPPPPSPPLSAQIWRLPLAVLLLRIDIPDNNKHRWKISWTNSKHCDCVINVYFNYGNI